MSSEWCVYYQWAEKKSATTFHGTASIWVTMRGQKDPWKCEGTLDSETSAMCWSRTLPGGTQCRVRAFTPTSAQLVRSDSLRREQIVEIKTCGATRLVCASRQKGNSHERAQIYCRVTFQVVGVHLGLKARVKVWFTDNKKQNNQQYVANI